MKKPCNENCPEFPTCTTACNDYRKFVKFSAGSTWDFLCKYINLFEIGTEITRQEILISYRRTYNLLEREWVNASTIDTYLMLLRRIRVIETAGRGKYKILQLVPDQLTNQKAREIAVGEKWKAWFIELKDRV